ncbi:MAG TPA: SUMF1/EgtB/PvdO family nonheme iron enzyme [Candidatus Sulfotelmatobacter sp.]|jgi:ergothioneine biosynthesis protein EgtB|nr:SUMF1/EgtB/PvdO family nonheme iron enzyme [Candidatus Sulfotelmatobacter sp.]
MLAAQSQPEIAVRRQLLERIADARRRSDELFKIVQPGSIYERPIPERHRIIFYVGHLEAFDWNLLHENVGLQSFHSEFDRLFAFGIDPVGGGLPTDQRSDWPSVEAVRDYVRQIRAALDEKLADGSLESYGQGRGSFALDTLLNVAIEHRLMHVETLAYMFHQLPLEQKVPQKDPQKLVTAPVKHQMVRIPAGKTMLGLPRSGERFGWDNEFEAYTVDVPAFEIDQYEVTNRLYLDFMNAGGYDTRAYWSDDDWNWKTERAISHPVFWMKTRGGWNYRGMFEEVALPLDCPVYVSHAEAMAYARWAGKELPSEEQWQRAAYGSTDRNERFYPWGNTEPDLSFGNFDFSHWNPTAVNAFPEAASAFGVHDLLGNGWEWTSSVFGAFPGFEAFPFYPGYSANFFDGKHFVMKGGSPRTAACMLRPTFRNWFQAHYQYVYAGFRCVNSVR